MRRTLTRCPLTVPLREGAEKIGTLSVYGGLDGVLNELVRIKR